EIYPGNKTDLIEASTIISTYIQSQSLGEESHETDDPCNELSDDEFSSQ
ncbi:2952_t:CDS:1, partial [Acaulospora morrowiae]